jgi:hypothetical protein
MIVPAGNYFYTGNFKVACFLRNAAMCFKPKALNTA